MMTNELWNGQSKALGSFIRAQRELASLSLRQLSEMTDVSNAYLSQIERGLHEPSIRVIRSVARALGVAPEVLLSRAGLIDEDRAADEDADASGAASGGDASGRAGARTARSRPVKPAPAPTVEDVIRADPALGDAEKEALIAVYRSYVSARGAQG
jgi:transcriptional regulator with XRE-family HTH domain